jgi:hypothetical protein
VPWPWTTEEEPLDAREILRVLDDHRVDFVLVGGVAAIFHGYSAATFDADIVPATDLGNLLRLAAALQALDARLYADPRRTDLEPDGAPPEAAELDLADPETIRRRLSWYFSTRAGRLDVLLVIDGPGGYPTVVRTAVSTRVGDADVAIISLADLVESKETVGRPKDLAALDELRRLLAEQRRTSKG